MSISVKAEDDIRDTLAIQEEAAKELFQVDLDHLDPALELRKKIGGIDRQTDDSQSQLPDRPIGRVPRVIPNSRIRRYRKQLITPRAAWTRVTSALVELRLERLYDHQLYGSAAFRLAPLDSYDAQFEEFCELVEMGDIDLIYEFARKHPLHVDALLVVSDFMRISSASDALELTERAVYILEKCTLATSETGVDLTAGTLRLPYDEFDNRRMHLALLRYIQFLTKNGCYRTALEYSKILWSLDPWLDPVGVRMIADLLALQSGQYDWFTTVYTGHVKREAAWLANWHFSNALMHFIRGEGQEEADGLLQRAILENPWMVPKLADACGLQIHEASWLSSFRLPSLASSDHVKSLREALAKIYAQRVGPVWKVQQNRAWLEANLGIAISCRLSSSQEASLDAIDYRPSVLEAASVWRHAMVSDLTGVQVALPTRIAPTVGHLYDPLPPEMLGDASETLSSRCHIQ